MKTTFKIILALSFIILFTNTNIFAQGCVAIRSTGGIGMDEHPDSASNKGSWLFNSNSRYYKSFRHFVGREEQKERIDVLHNNVINKVFTQDFTLSRIINNRWSASIVLPFADYSRSQVSSGVRYSTHSFGVGDIHIGANYWLFDPAKAHKGNIQVGLGVKFATGAYNYQDYFLNGATGVRTLGAVDQSIQPGDGGTGITAEINTYYNFSRAFGFYGNFYYLANPRDVNGVPRSTSTPSATTLAATGDVLSVPDQMLIRAGFTLAVKKVDFSLGLREDCLPVWDFFGNSDGFRRPGHIFSLEPGLTYNLKKVSLYLYVPTSIIRDRTQSVPDRRTSAITNKYTQGDAAFADYVVNVGLTYKF